MQSTRANNLKLAEKGVWLSILAYIVLSILQIAIATYVNSDSLRANGFNNVTDILGNIALLIGLRMARIPADSDHVYGHWKVESIASLISSFIMAMVGFEVLREVVTNLLHNLPTAIDPLGAWVGVFSAIVMLVVYFYNRNLSKRAASTALAAATKDNLSDAAISIGTSVAILAASFHWLIVDRAAAILICIFIFKTAYSIFKDSAFSLSDGFDDELLEQYRAAIIEFEKVKSVKLLRGRTYGSNIFLDVVVEMSPDLSVSESHATTEKIEKALQNRFDVYDTDVHVEPSALPDEEKESSLVLKLLGLEEALLLGNGSLADNFTEISAIGVKSNTPTLSSDGILHYQAERVSARTYILTYQTGDTWVSSVWRRNEHWYCLFRQLTSKTDPALDDRKVAP